MSADPNVVVRFQKLNGDPTLGITVRGINGVVSMALAMALSTEVGLQEMGVESLASLLLSLDGARRQNVTALLAEQGLNDILEEILTETLPEEVTN